MARAPQGGHFGDPVAGSQLLALLSKEWLGFDYSIRDYS